MSGASGRHATYRWLATARYLRRSIRLWQVACGVLGGNLLLHQLPIVPSAAVLIAIAAAACAIGRPAPLPAVVLIAFCWTGFVAGAGLDARWPPAADGQDIDLVGWIDSIPARDAGRTVFTLRVVEAATDRPIRRVRLSWYDPAPVLTAGQSVAIEARLRAPRGLVNPGGFDYERWLFLERLDATGYVRDGAVEPGASTALAARWLRFRASLVERLGQSIVPSDAAALIQALALGERDGFEDRHWRVPKASPTPGNSSPQPTLNDDVEPTATNGRIPCGSRMLDDLGVQT